MAHLKKGQVCAPDDAGDVVPKKLATYFAQKMFFEVADIQQCGRLWDETWRFSG
jgi:hypothetical protein